jgi:hypothetical protein
MDNTYFTRLTLNARREHFDTACAAIGIADPMPC